MATKTCAECAQTKPVAAFYRKKRPKGKYAETSAGLSHACKTCVIDARKSYYRENTGKCDKTNMDSRLRRTYGIGVVEYNSMLEAQDFKCKICTRHKSEFPYRLSVDHCHKTGAVRGLLCKACNTALGLVKDKTAVLENMISYLNNSTGLAVTSNISKVG